MINNTEISKIVKHGSGGVMMGACFAATSLGENLAAVDFTLNSSKHVKMQRCKDICLTIKLGRVWILLCENYPKHKAATIQSSE